jgi:hypothetical protein
MYRNSWPLLALATYRNILTRSVITHNGHATSDLTKNGALHEAKG